jgi:hypothetical protein
MDRKKILMLIIGTALMIAPLAAFAMTYEGAPEPTGNAGGSGGGTISPSDWGSRVWTCDPDTGVCE